MNVRFVCLLMGVLAFMAGCSSAAGNAQDENQPEFFHYQCDASAWFDVAYDAKGSAILRLSDHSYRLIQVAAGSGTKYILDDNSSASNPVTLFTKGDAARLDVNGVIYKNCRRQR